MEIKFRFVSKFVATMVAVALIAGAAMFAGAAANAGLRLYQRAVPVKSLLPDFVVTLITPPPVVPYSAE